MRVGRILSVGTDSHRRLQRPEPSLPGARGLFLKYRNTAFMVFCDGILYIRRTSAIDDTKPQVSGRWNQPTAASELISSRPPESQRGTYPSGADLSVGLASLLGAIRSGEFSTTKTGHPDHSGLTERRIRPPVHTLLDR